MGITSQRGPGRDQLTAILWSLVLATCNRGAKGRAPDTQPHDASNTAIGGAPAVDGSGAPGSPDGSTSQVMDPPPAMGTMVGLATEDVTPPFPTWMENSDQLNSSHYRKLEVKAMAIRAESEPVVIVTADICDFCSEISNVVYERVKPLGLTPERIVLNSSHIHSTPAA